MKYKILIKDLMSSGSIVENKSIKSIIIKKISILEKIVNKFKIILVN
jgi:hypothetical protein